MTRPAAPHGLSFTPPDASGAVTDTSTQAGANRASFQSKNDSITRAVPVPAAFGA